MEEALQFPNDTSDSLRRRMQEVVGVRREGEREQHVTDPPTALRDPGSTGEDKAKERRNACSVGKSGINMRGNQRREV